MPAGIFYYLIFIAWAVFALLNMWFDLISTAGFFKITVTAVVALVLVFVIGLLRNSSGK